MKQSKAKQAHCRDRQAWDHHHRSLSLSCLWSEWESGVHLAGNYGHVRVGDHQLALSNLCGTLFPSTRFTSPDLPIFITFSIAGRLPFSHLPSSSRQVLPLLLKTTVFTQNDIFHTLQIFLLSNPNFKSTLLMPVLKISTFLCPYSFKLL